MHYLPPVGAMTHTEITSIFRRFAALKVGVIGDFALDLYFDLQTQTGERSLETGKDVLRGTHPVASLGAAGNIVQNLTALGASQIWIVGCLGDDLFGREMQHLFDGLNVHQEHLHLQNMQWDTCVYAKPMQHGQEANRVDFGTANSLNDRSFAKIMDSLDQLLPTLDVLIINQQFASPLLPSRYISALNHLITQFPKVHYIADMREVGMLIGTATLKVNTAELAKFLKTDLPEYPTLDWCIQQGRVLQHQRNGPLLITRGAEGVLFIDIRGHVQSETGLPLSGLLDTVGAGDTIVAAWAACTGAGATPAQALKIANLAAAVTVQKLAQTGTASLPEILALYNTHFSHDERNDTELPAGTLSAPHH